MIVATTIDPARIWRLKELNERQVSDYNGRTPNGNNRSETAFHTNQRSQDRSYIRMTDSPASRKAAAE
jgi:hypothetical protein